MGGFYHHYSNLSGKVPINAETGQVESSQNDMSGYATYQDLTEYR